MKFNHHLLIFPFIIFFFTGCSTPYQPLGMMGGYNSHQMKETVFEVSFKGNANTSYDHVMDHLLYRCAELTRENGFEYFIVIQDQSFSDRTDQSSTMDQPGKTTATMSGGQNTRVDADFTISSDNTAITGVCKSFKSFGLFI